jgi:hypothetical protein
LAALGESLAPVLGLAGHLHVWLGFDDEGQPAPHERLIVGDQHAERRGHERVGSKGSVASTR